MTFLWQVCCDASKTRRRGLPLRGLLRLRGRPRLLAGQQSRQRLQTHPRILEVSVETEEETERSFSDLGKGKISESGNFRPHSPVELGLEAEPRSGKI